MKKLTIIAIMLMVSAAAFGQNFRFGISGGMNLSKEHLRNLNMNYGNKVGFSAGLIGELSFTNNLYVNTSVLYSTKGYDSGDSEDKDNQTSNYLEVPIHLGYNYPITNKISVLGEAGPYFGYLMSAKGYDEGYKWDGTEDFNKLDVGIGFKVGAEFIKRFRLTVGYDWGLSNIYKEDWGKVNNRNFTVGVTLFF